MVSDQYHVNVAMTNEMMAENSEKTRDIKGSISSPIPSEDVTSVLEYFGITSSSAGATSEKMDNHQFTMQAHNRLVNALKTL